jgi:hypothetical protein
MKPVKAVDCVGQGKAQTAAIPAGIADLQRGHGAKNAILRSG